VLHKEHKNVNFPKDLDSSLAFQSFFESAPMMMGIVELEGEDIRHLYENEAASTFFGSTPELIKGRLASELGVSSEVIKTWVENYQKAEASKTSAQFIYKHEKSLLSVVVSFMGKSDSGLSRFSYIAQDITVAKANERKLEEKTRNELRYKDDKYNLVVEGIKDHAIIRTDKEANILDWNTGAENIFLWNRNEVIGKNIDLIFTPEDLASNESEKETLKAAQNGRSDDKRYHIKKDGSRFYANGSMNALKDIQGSLIGFVKVVQDDSLKKSSEELLKFEKVRAEIAEERFKAATMETNVGVWEFDLSQKKFWRSESHAKLYGLDDSASAWDPEKISEHIIKEDRQPVLDAFYEAISSRQQFSKQYRVIWPDGSMHWLSAKGKLLYNESGNPQKLVGTLIDITEVKHAEKKVEASRKELEDVFLQAPVPLVILTGPDFYFSLANPPYEKLFGRKVQGKTVLEVFTEDEIKVFLPLLKEVYETGKPYIGKESSITTRDENNLSRTHFLDFGYYPYKNSDGSIKGVLAVVNDVTEQVEARKILEQSETRFRVLANSLPIIIWTATPEFFVDWYNDWWFKYLGLPQGTRWDDLENNPMLLEDVVSTKNKIKEFLEFGEPFTMEQKFRRGSDGSYRWHLVKGVPVKDASGNIIKWVGANTDIHDQKILLEKLEEERDLREQFVATLSHDLRTPLTVAKMNAQIIARKSNDADRVLKSAVKIDDNINRADSMIRDLLDASQVKAGQKLQLEKSQCHLNFILSEVVEELSTIHGDRFKIQMEPDIHGEWSCTGVRRILENLCNNAVKYGSPIKPVTISAKQDDNCISILIHNEGNPIPIEDQKVLFEPFKRVNSGESGKQKGWGLGLTLVKGLTEAHGGTITVESNEEKGTTFTVKIPK